MIVWDPFNLKPFLGLVIIFGYHLLSGLYHGSFIYIIFHSLKLKFLFNDVDKFLKSVD